MKGVVGETTEDVFLPKVLELGLEFEGEGKRAVVVFLVIKSSKRVFF